MTQPPNPIALGFRAAWQQPVTFLLEMIWRWTFWIIAGFLLFGAGVALLGPLHMSDSILAAWRSQNPSKMGFVALNIVLLLGTKLAVALAALPVGLALLWSILASIARRIVVGRLARREPLGGGAMMVVQWLRALTALLAVLLLIAALAGALYWATRGPQPDLFRFYLVCAPSLPLIMVTWLALNWQLSMTAIFGREGQGFRTARQQTRQTVRQQRSDFAGTAFIFLLLRTVALLAAAAICGFTSHMLATSPQAYMALVMTVALGYFVVSDFLYVARIGAYLALAAARVDAVVVEFSSAFPRP